MRSVQVFDNVTLDGVMQAPGFAEEDTRGGFPHGGWAIPYADEVTTAPGGGGPGELLLGRRTYQSMERGWRDGPADNPFTAIMNASTKYVASRTLTAPLEWQNSVLLDGDAVDAVARLRSTEGRDLTVLGSGELVRALAAAQLVDRFVLLIHPLVLGGGIRLFDDTAAYARLRLVDARPSPTGVIVATYEPN